MCVKEEQFYVECVGHMAYFSVKKGVCFNASLVFFQQNQQHLQVESYSQSKFKVTPDRFHECTFLETASCLQTLPIWNGPKEM